MSQNLNSRHYRFPISKLTIHRPTAQPSYTTVRCHGCGGDLVIRADPARLWIGLTYVEVRPCLEAPHICGACRRDPVRLHKARDAMERHWEIGEHRKAAA